MSNPSKVSVGYEHSCAVDDTGVVCWGNSTYGQADVPADLGTIISLSAGGYHTCVVDSVGLISCWGRDDSGQSTVPEAIIITL